MKKTSQLLLPLALFLMACACKQNTTTDATQAKLLTDFIENGSKSILPDFSYAGYAYGEKEVPTINGPVFRVEDYGAIADDSIDDTEAIQKAVDAAGKAGGGVVLFPKGQFDVNSDTTRQDIIRINYSNIVMRGAGMESDGTIIHSHTPTTQTEENSPWLSPFVFHTGLSLQSTNNFFDIDELPVYSKLMKDAPKGENVLELAQTKGLKAGDILVVAMRNTSDEGDLMHHLMAPLKFDHFMSSYLDAGKNRRPSFQYFLEIDKILSDTEVQMKQAMRRDILTQFEAFVCRVPMLKNVGIEHFRFECDYQGGYKHHLTREHDYGWGAVCLQRVAHGWIRNLHINNYVQTTHLVNSRNISISAITLTGYDGHYGPKMYHSSDNLVYNIDVQAKYTHGPGLEGCCFGNVYRKINHTHPVPVDLHGIGGADFSPPACNLYEECTNLTRMAGGGAPENIPHASEYNTFWGLKMAGFDDDGYNELFYSWIWRDPKRFKNEFHIDCHKQYLRSILVGIHHPEKTLSIEHNTEDRADEWIYVEGLNENMNLPSLYKTQLALRLKK
ncbi:glycosyl hydrolase family 28-related protein [uncultured Draconibacterium sp.]|uniref:glycosyl hydrolase family 28-related protein n=1 Tax=uncultured Draconibacterium sp. TaxID=1573823 RepID=UPI0025E58CEE|nr:glycosyl hydrolase family 28-related protein [uncultured Draconibacterium sp.]